LVHGKVLVPLDPQRAGVSWSRWLVKDVASEEFLLEVGEEDHEVADEGLDLKI
jgi:hypothetical protein